jgi:hypothetical protein
MPAFEKRPKILGENMKKIAMALALCFSLNAYGEVPAELERASYSEWLSSIGSVSSPYLEPIFDWYEEQKGSALPPQVEADPERLFVSVERPLQQTVEAEEMGDVERGVTYGLETYGLVDAPVDVVLETILFRWGKPVGAESGVTYPVDTVFGYREERLAPKWGPRAYATNTVMKNGGVAKEQNDASSLLVFGDSTKGYVLVGQFFGPNGKTPSTSSMSIIILNPVTGGKTDYRVSGRYTGQSYLIFGIEHGRRNYGFNATRIRAGQKDFLGMVKSLKTTGKIPERRP